MPHTEIKHMETEIQEKGRKITRDYLKQTFNLMSAYLLETGSAHIEKHIRE